MEKKVIIERRSAKAETKPIFVSPEVHEKLKALRDETNITIGELAEIFINFGIENVVFKERSND